MKIRKGVFPKTPIDVGAFLFVSLLIPSAYWFELFIVLPDLYEIGSFYYWMHFTLGHFLMLNITGSFIGVILIDNSVQRHLMQREVKPHWRHCNICNIVVPPRSWHCMVCNTCMLKRDHHCMFTGYCVGHHNHHLFMMFLFYTLVGGIYATFYNCYFLLKRMVLSRLLLRTLFSVPLFFSEKDVDPIQIYLMIFYMVIFGTALVLVLFIYHARLIVSGQVGYESKHNNFEYNMGAKQNFINVFGERWYLSWLSPFITSKLPNDGFQWEVKLTNLKQL